MKINYTELKKKAKFELKFYAQYCALVGFIFLSFMIFVGLALLITQTPTIGVLTLILVVIPIILRILIKLDE